MSETDCVFCKLISGELERSVIYQDDLCLALMDIQPVTPGHALVVPRRHAAYLADLDAEDGAQMFRAAQRVAAALRECGVKCEGVNFFLPMVRLPGRRSFMFTYMFSRVTRAMDSG
ncbi:MAG TPA: HIT domain-containing protein [Pyrinomonadaceae bacterium]|nr:HIT domain-containing protein [Pyrinomonadaceae bacterium]